MVTENNNRQSDTKEVLTNNQDKKHVLLCIRGQIPSTIPPGGLYLEGRFNEGFFALPVWGAYIWRGLYMEGLIFGILRYYSERFLFSRGQKMSKDFLSSILGQIIVSNLIKCV